MDQIKRPAVAPRVCFSVGGRVRRQALYVKEILSGFYHADRPNCRRGRAANGGLHFAVMFWWDQLREGKNSYDERIDDLQRFLDGLAVLKILGV
jgi:hypothetical protein